MSDSISKGRDGMTMTATTTTTVVNQNLIVSQDRKRKISAAATAVAAVTTAAAAAATPPAKARHISLPPAPPRPYRKAHSVADLLDVTR